MSPNPSTRSLPRRSVIAGTLSNMGMDSPVPAPRATSTITLFLNMRCEKNTQNMSYKNIMDCKNVASFRLGSRKAACIMQTIELPRTSWNNHPKLELRKATQPATKPAATNNATQSLRLRVPKASRHATLRRKPGCKDTKAELPKLVVQTNPARQNMIWITYTILLINLKRTTSETLPMTNNPIESSRLNSITSSFFAASGESSRRSAVETNAPAQIKRHAIITINGSEMSKAGET
mmetsp:Transcript_98733/g.156098  ORF Transcript_98733/g.156098 Transcript_98733/m.156098 type:complete len:236 (+) Transcript_98733:531-1238(+)